MKDIKNYQEYEQLFKDDLVIAVRGVLEYIEDKGEHDFEDSNQHNGLIGYFNRFALHKKISEKEFLKWDVED